MVHDRMAVMKFMSMVFMMAYFPDVYSHDVKKGWLTGKALLHRCSDHEMESQN